MIERLPLSDQDLIHSLKDHYGIEVAALTFLPIGADMNASLFKANTPNKISYFIKLKRGHHPEISIAIVELLQSAGIQEIIPPIKTIQGRPTQPLKEFTLIVYPFIEGQDGFSRKLTDEQWIKLGKAFKQIHEIPIPSPIQHRLRREDYSPKWRAIVRSLYAHIDSKPSGDQSAMTLMKFMKKNQQTILRLVDRAESLGQTLQTQSHPFVLCHSDIHGGNVLLQDNDAIYIVDWDDPILAPKERDLMFIGGGVGNVWNQPQEEKLFYQGYGKKTQINPLLLAYYRQERIVEDIAEYGQELLLKTARGEDRSEMLKQFIGMFDPRGVVEIAYKTDKAAV